MVTILASVILIVCGLVVLIKGDKLLNEDGDEAQAKKNARILGILMFAEAAVLILRMLSTHYGLTAVSTAFTVIGIALLVFSFVLTNVSGRKKKDAGNDREDDSGSDGEE